MISNQCKWRKHTCTILGRGTGALSNQLRVSYLSKGGRTQFRLVWEHEVTMLEASTNDLAAGIIAANKRKASNLVSRPGWDDVIKRTTKN